MKYKLIALAACLLALGAAAMPSLLKSQTTPTRYHQHMMAEEKAPCTHDETRFCSHLPLVFIDTDGVEIPGRTIGHDNGKRIYSTTEDGGTMTDARITIVDNTGTNNHPGDAAAMDSAAQIRVRGRSSRHFDKTSFFFRLLNEDGTNNPQSVMGMDPHHEWALHGPFLDKTLIRNYMWYNISGEIMDYAPNVRFCEVFVNGEYRGLYLAVETITAGKNGARLSLSVDRKQNTFTGYLLRHNDYDPDQENDAYLDNFLFATKQSGMPMEVLYPGAANLTPEILRGIELEYTQFEKALSSYDYDVAELGYRKYVDVDSFVDYLIINELTANYDAGRLSTYIYKDLDGKYRMCVWDFNNCCDNYIEQATDVEGFWMYRKDLFFMMLKDEYFTERVIARYNQLRTTWLAPDFLDSYIDDTINYLGDAIDRNFQVWGYTFAEEYGRLTPADRNLDSYPAAVQQLKDFLAARGAWLDENIVTLRQYSAESAVKKYNENAD